MSKYFASIRFERYAEDIIVYCCSGQEADSLLASFKERLSEVKRMVNKIKI